MSYSDGEGEFGEDRGEPMSRVDMQAEFVVALAEVLYEGVSCADHLRRAQLFQSAHGPQPGLPSAVIGFDGIIGVLLDDVAGGGQ
jgi:hypothetical protein